MADSKEKNVKRAKKKNCKNSKKKKNLWTSKSVITQC